MLNYRREQLMGGEGRSRGKDFERDLFGAPRTGDPAYQKELMKLQPRRGEYVPFAPAYELARKFQPKPKQFAFKLTHKVAEVLGKNPKFKGSIVRFVTTVDTPIDQYHGADAVIEVIFKDRESIRIRLGATMADELTKSERKSKKPDVEIEEEWLNPEDEEKINSEKIPELANQIVRCLEEEMEVKEVA